MTLDQYLNAEKISGADFAHRVGTSGASITRIRKGQQSPSPELMARIITATGGKVTLEALVFPESRAA
jgi:transcriptional regulator with XRE-family HTH domain